MNRVIWGMNGAQLELERLTHEEDKLDLDVIEVPHQSGLFFYEVLVHGKEPIAAVDIGSTHKDLRLTDSISRYADAYEMRNKLSRILEIPHNCYQRYGEKVLAGLATEDLTVPAENRHMSPAAELGFVFSTLLCANTIGFSKVQSIGRIETDVAVLREALGFLSQSRKGYTPGKYEVA